MRPETARQRRAPTPLDPAALEALALGYAARFATTAAKLEAYLARKLRERGWDAEAPRPDIAALVQRMVASGYVDDAAFAAARGSSLRRRGYGARRIDETLRAAGVDEGLREEARGSAAQGRQAALALARRRGFGPFSRGSTAVVDPRLREKQVAAMLRAGHPLASARVLVDAGSVAAAEAWACGDGDPWDDGDNER